MIRRMRTWFDPSPNDPIRSKLCTCRYFRTYPNKAGVGDHPLKQTNPRCPVCDQDVHEPGPIAVQMVDHWRLEDPPWW